MSLLSNGGAGCHTTALTDSLILQLLDPLLDAWLALVVLVILRDVEMRIVNAAKTSGCITAKQQDHAHVGTSSRSRPQKWLPPLIKACNEQATHCI